MSGKRELLALVLSITEQAQMICCDEEQVQEDCARFLELMSNPPDSTDIRYIKRLLIVLEQNDGSDVATLFNLLAKLIPQLENPWPYLKRMLLVEDEERSLKACELVGNLVATGDLALDDKVLLALAHLLKVEDGPTSEPEMMASLFSLISTHYKNAALKNIAPLAFLLQKSTRREIKELAAILLDSQASSVPPETVELLLGTKVFKVLNPFFEYTRATHVELLSLIQGKRVPANVVRMFADAVKICGAEVVRTALSELGWQKINLGIKVEPYVELSVPGSLPIMVKPEEVALIEAAGNVTRAQDCYLVTGHGGSVAQKRKSTSVNNPIDRFRSLNLAHAEVLGEIVDLAPLEPVKVQRILAFMDQIVEDYGILFGETSEECSILPDVYLDLRQRIKAELDLAQENSPLSTELTRLVQMFEDPDNLGGVRTLHGLKRYLHQKGLKLGFNLVEATHAANRTVDQVLIVPGEATRQTQTLQYAEFESSCETDEAPWLPYPVRLVVNGFARQMLYGQETFPRVSVFIFGNEVHYFIYFRNHPVFLRIDYSPPQRGGMIDLEYYGVSNYELDIHPNITLDAIRLFFRKLDFGVRMEETRLFLRYDKERSSDLGDMCKKIQALFRLTPHLMEIDWAIGSLQLDDHAKLKVARAWARRFRQSGVLPLHNLISSDRRGILLDVAIGPEGPVETVWDGTGSYEDRYSRPIPDQLLENLNTAKTKLWLQTHAIQDAENRDLAGVFRVEKTILKPIRKALRRGQVVVTDNQLRPASPQLFQVEHAAERFAELLYESGSQVQDAIALAVPITILERFLKFEIIGYVGALQVVRSVLFVRGGQVRVFALRDKVGQLQMGLYSTGSRLVRHRKDKKDKWTSNASTDVKRLWSLLRCSNYVGSIPDSFADDSTDNIDTKLTRIFAYARQERAAGQRRPTDDERFFTGLKASPGRAVGRAIFGTENRRCEDVAGSVLVAREIKPTDNQFLFHCAGIVSAGGAVLSHAALLAMQFGKPAVVTDARWSVESDKSKVLHFSTTVHREMPRVVHGFSICVRGVFCQRNDVLREGDFVVLDADEGLVKILGQGRDALALAEGLRLMSKSNYRNGRPESDMEQMNSRALQLRARHQIRKTVDRLSNPTLASFAVEEFVLGASFKGVRVRDKSKLLSQILENPEVGSVARIRLTEITQDLVQQYFDIKSTAELGVPNAEFLYEVIGLRLRARQCFETLIGAVSLLTACGVELKDANIGNPDVLDKLAWNRMLELRDRLHEELNSQSDRQKTQPRLRHLLRRVERISEVLSDDWDQISSIDRNIRLLHTNDQKSLATTADKYLLNSTDCGLETNPQIGWKAANLAEMQRLAGYDVVPPWFVVTDHAFKMMLEQPAPLKVFNGGTPASVGSLRDVITLVLERTDLDNASKSTHIQELWKNTVLPTELERQVLDSYANLGDTNSADPFVAIRSSSCDEDTESAMRAGEFESYMYVLGSHSVIDHLKLTWSGLWTERALYTREAESTSLVWPSGGLIVQRMVGARVSGVLQTVNVACGDLGEMLINVGLGLGEGIVSGAVAADMVMVRKLKDPSPENINFNYITNDKLKQIEFDETLGYGTRVANTLYHQRLRPALEYLELIDIIALANRLENSYGYPLDIEFAIEGSKLWLLQARPIALFLGEIYETINSHPIKKEVRENVSVVKNQQ